VTFNLCCASFFFRVLHGIEIIYLLTDFIYILILNIFFINCDIINYNVGYRCAIIPGGIAEMYLVSEKSEGLFLRKRQNTIKAAIQEGRYYSYTICLLLNKHNSIEADIVTEE
jgi:hypothetical protein